MKKTTLSQKIRRFESGQSLIELAVSLTLLMILLGGIVDVGRAIFTLFAMQDAAEEGIVYGTSFPTDCVGIHHRIEYNLGNRSFGGGMTAVVEITNNGGQYVTCESIPLVQVYAGKMIRVSVTKTFSITMPFIGAFIGQEIPLHASATGVILRPQPPNP
jgi:hypothetical protein